MGKINVKGNIGWLKGMRVGKKIWFHGKLYKAVYVGSFSTTFEEVENPRAYHKILINLKHWVGAIWKSFLWGLKRG